MLAFAVLFAIASVGAAGHIPYSYQSVTFYPTHSVKVSRADEWSAPLPKVEEWKPVEWKVPEEWKAPEAKIEPPVEWKYAEPKYVQEWQPTEEPKAAEVSEWKAPEPAPVEWKSAHAEWKEPEAPANYDFKYEVHDEKTGDIKRQSETAVNGAVKGQYSLIDSDGFKRIVEYTADDHHGFQATVKREPTHFKVPIPAPKMAEKW